MHCQRVERLSPELVDMLEEAQESLMKRRGGAALFESFVGERSVTALLDELVASGSLWVAQSEHQLHGVAVVRNGVVSSIYVAPSSRRQGVARSLLTALLESDAAPQDAYALPGDRATKSLYESMGWKARLLTMRAD